MLNQIDQTDLMEASKLLKIAGKKIVLSVYSHVRQTLNKLGEKVIFKGIFSSRISKAMRSPIQN